MTSSITSYDRVEGDALQLSCEERPKLAQRLLESLDDLADQPSPQWRDEIQRRMREIDGGKATLIPHDQVIEEAKARVREVRQGKSGV